MKNELWITDKSGKRRRAYWKTCPICKNEFTDRALYGKVFCSLKCKNKSQEKNKVNLKCAVCKKEFIRLASKCRGKNKIYFCSKGCKDIAARLDGIKEIHPEHYGTSSAKYRQFFAESDLVCRRCGYKEFTAGIDIHHLDRNRNNNDKSNLIPLCASCHRALHRKLWNFDDLNKGL